MYSINMYVSVRVGWEISWSRFYTFEQFSILFDRFNLHEQQSVCIKEGKAISPFPLPTNIFSWVRGRNNCYPLPPVENSAMKQDVQ